MRGPFRGASGTDHLSREFTRQFLRRGLRVQLIDVPEWSPVKLPIDSREATFEQLVGPVESPITLHFTMPHQVVLDPSTMHVNYTAFEATRVPESWIAQNLKHARVIVPTDSSRDAWVASGYPPDRIRICPEGVDPQAFGPHVAPLRLQTETGRAIASFGKRFLNVSELGPRKNIAGILRAWLRATRSDDDAILVLKLGHYSTVWLDHLKQQIREMERELGRGMETAAPVEILFDILPGPTMPRLYAMATHYISLSHGEGWDQTMIEAAATGLQLIAPDHSAYRSYLTPDIASLIPSRLIPARFDGDPNLQALFADADWWEPDAEASAEAIRAAIDGPEPNSTTTREAIVSRYTWEQATDRLIEILDELLVSVRLL